ncbi:MAG: hypothetical protein AAGC79_13170 [Pseudomonadota bacterium]
MRASNGGFSVLEALIAFVILAASLAALLPPMERMISRTSNAEQAWLAHEIGLSRLALLRAAPGMAVEETNGINGAFSWEMTLKPELLADEAPSGFGELMRVHLVVRDRATGRRLAEFETLHRGAAR